MPIIYALLLIVIILGLLGIIYIISFNKIQSSKIKIDEAESIIDENLRLKYDIEKKIEALIENTVKDQKINFKELKDIKTDELSNFELERKLTDNMLLICKIRNDYKELDENKDFKIMINDIKRLDEKVGASKTYFNKYTTEYNTLVRKFPSNIIAKFHGFKIKNFFDNKDLNDDIINDFKI